MNPFAKWTEAEVLARNARVAGNYEPFPPPPVKIPRVDDGREMDLQIKVVKALQKCDCIIGYSRLGLKSTFTEGWPDLTVLTPGGRLLLIEMKTATGRLSEAQAELRAALAALGHTVHVCRSMEDVLRLL